MATLAERTETTVSGFEEKDFYLDEFRAHTLCFAVTLADCEQAGGFEMLGTVVRDLIANDSRVILLLGVETEGRPEASCMPRVRKQLRPFVLADQAAARFPLIRGHRSLDPCFLDVAAIENEDGTRSLEALWRVLRSVPLAIALVNAATLVETAQRLTTRLRVHKLVIVEPAGGIATPQGGPLSFMDDTMLTAVLQAGEAEWTGLQERRATLRSIQAALRGGVHAVNLCTLNGLARELFSYEGSGTLFTLEDYCQIDRLGIDDFEAVERLLERGQREGFLKRRAWDETARILLNGYGAAIGARHLAGVCALETEPYTDERAGEIVALYTITRFKGEGVGARLVERVLKDATAAGLSYVFACTVDPRAQAFFERRGFRLVSQKDVPAAKWAGYDEARLEQVKILRHDLDGAQPTH
jgi:amino-acid N-acetyltransferase